MIFGMILGAVGSIIGGIGKKKQAKAQKKAAKFNAKLAARNAEIIRERTDINLTRLNQETIRATGGAVAGFSKGGVEISGSALDVLRETARNSALDASLIKKQGEIDENAFLSQAKGFTSEAKQAKTAGQIGFASGIVSAAGSLLGN